MLTKPINHSSQYMTDSDVRKQYQLNVRWETAIVDRLALYFPVRKIPAIKAIKGGTRVKAPQCEIHLRGRWQKVIVRYLPVDDLSSRNLVLSQEAFDYMEAESLKTLLVTNSRFALVAPYHRHYTMKSGQVCFDRIEWLQTLSLINS